MTPSARQYLRELLLKHEGFRQFPYRCTAGKLTIGIGRNLEDNGILLDESLILLENDIQNTERLLLKAFPTYARMNDARKVALLDMAFNMGINRFMTFKKMLAALEAGDWHTAVKKGFNSKWAAQVGNRAHDDMYLIEQGVIHE